MSQYFDPLVKCPFYICDRKLSGVNNHKIACEPVSGTDDLQLSFVSASARDAFKNRYCRKITAYKQCPIASVLNQKYNEKSSV